jgi:methyl-accepting chemotaxis protein
MGFIHRIITTLVLCAAVFFAGCRSQPVLIDTADFERYRQESIRLRNDYARLQQDHRELTERSEHYANYYHHATERIAHAAGELRSLTASQLTEIAKLREYVTILRSIVQDIADTEHTKGFAAVPPGADYKPP